MRARRREPATSDDEPVVLVDARNVLRSRWPNIRADRLLDLIRDWAEHERARVIAVFDGRAPSGSVGGGELDDRAVVVGTGGGSADDWIAEHARELARNDRRVWLVSSDRGLRARVAGRVERTIGGGSFAAELETLQGRRYYRPAGTGEESADGGEDG
jgi:predicted RNA-binding protein with PIN domain